MYQSPLTIKTGPFSSSSYNVLRKWLVIRPVHGANVTPFRFQKIGISVENQDQRTTNQISSYHSLCPMPTLCPMSLHLRGLTIKQMTLLLNLRQIDPIWKLKIRFMIQRQETLPIFYAYTHINIVNLSRSNFSYIDEIYSTEWYTSTKWNSKKGQWILRKVRYKRYFHWTVDMEFLSCDFLFVYGLFDSRWVRVFCVLSYQLR